jgi:hypothetical protein
MADRAYSIGGRVSLCLQGCDFTKESYGGVQSDRLGGRLVGISGGSDDAKITFGGVHKGRLACRLDRARGLLRVR